MSASASLLDAFAKAHPKKIDLSLGRMQTLLDALANPEKRLPPVIHIAGTNGKGSTIAFLSAMLDAAGRTHHRYHSPHLIRFHERIMLNNKPIDESQLTHYLELCDRANDGRPITFFEITTAAAFAAFADTSTDSPADYLLLEVGLGGRLDATNLVSPYLTAITSIDYDHQEFLGDTLEKIAYEKAGIIKKNVPLISAPQIEAAATIIRTKAAAEAAPLSLGNQDWQIFPDYGRLTYQDEHGLLDLPLPALAGAHQYINAGVAINLARHIGLKEADIATGLTHAHWQGRLQHITLKDYPNHTIWLDGAHNPAGAKALAIWAQEKNRPCTFIIAMMGNKDATAYFENIATYAGAHITIYTCPLKSQDNGADAQDLCRTAQNAGLTASAHPSLEAALKACETDMIVIAGSLYLAQDILEK